MQVLTVAERRASLLGQLLLAVDDSRVGWSAQGDEVVVLVDWGDWLHHFHVLEYIASSHLWGISGQWVGSSGGVDAMGFTDSGRAVNLGGCLMTYGMAVEYPTGRRHDHVVQLSEAERRRNTARFRQAWSFGPPYTFRLELLRAILRVDLSHAASEEVSSLYARQLSERALPEHVRLAGGRQGGDLGAALGKDEVLGEPYWEVGLVLPLVELAGLRVCSLGSPGDSGASIDGRRPRGDALYVFNVVTRGNVHRHSGLLGHQVIRIIMLDLCG